MASCPVLGFTVQMDPAPGVDPGDLGAAFLRLLASRGLQDIGSGAPATLEFLVASEGGQATDLDRAAIVTWLATRAEVTDYGVGPLVDLERTADA